MSPFPNVLEAEPNDTPEATSATAAALPVAFNGIIDKPGDVDCFRSARRRASSSSSTRWRNALGSPLDPVIWVKAVGAKTGRRGDSGRPTRGRTSSGCAPAGGLNRETHDPVLEFTAPADGEYVLGVEDERGEGGADYVYRVEVTPEENAVYTYIAPEPENQFAAASCGRRSPFAAGNRTTVQVGVFATNRPFAGELELVGVNLPKGVTLHAPEDHAGHDEGAGRVRGG